MSGTENYIFLGYDWWWITLLLVAAKSYDTSYDAYFTPISTDFFIKVRSTKVNRYKIFSPETPRPLSCGGPSSLRPISGAPTDLSVGCQRTELTTRQQMLCRRKSLHELMYVKRWAKSVEWYIALLLTLELHLFQPVDQTQSACPQNASPALSTSVHADAETECNLQLCNQLP